MNAPENYELFTLPDGISKIQMEKDSKIPNTMLFTVMLEDHTIGNIIKMQLLRDETIRYAGYRKPHPLEHKVEFRVSTNGEITPLEVFKKAINSLLLDLDISTKKFNQSISQIKSNMVNK